MGRVDDPLVLPAAPGVGAGRAQHRAERSGEGAQLGTAFTHSLGRLREARAPPGAHLDLGGDELADEVLLDRRPSRGSLQLLESVDERERLRVEEGELLLDRERQVGAAVVGLARLPDQLVVRDTRRFTH